METESKNIVYDSVTAGYLIPGHTPASLHIHLLNF